MWGRLLSAFSWMSVFPQNGCARRFVNAILPPKRSAACSSPMSTATTLQGCAFCSNGFIGGCMPPPGRLRRLQRAADADAVALSDAAVAVGDIQVQPFHTPHDARESMGYCFEMPDERRVAVATDMGCLLPQAEALLSSCDLVHIESNHDVGMLQNGPYPYVLQQRILSDHGHLSNAVCAAALPRLAAAGVTRFTLAHLSEQNNMPTLARDTATAALAAAGFAADRDYRLAVAPPVSASPVTIL